METVARDLVEYVARALADEPERVEVDEQTGATTVVTLSVASADLGRIIGRQGRTAKALRTLIAAKAHHLGRRINLEILD